MSHVSNSNNPMHYKYTPWAILLTILLVIPGMILGALARHLYVSQLEGYFDGNLIDWVSQGWFKTLFMSVVPHAIHFGVAGAFAIWVCSKILKSANYEIVAYSVSGIFVALTLFLTIIVIASDGLSIGTIEQASETGGFVLGVFSVWAERLRI